MKLVQRFIPYNDEFHDAVLPLLVKHRNACDSIWVTTESHTTLENHARVSQKLQALAEKYRAKGYSVSLQIGTTVGHGFNASADDFSGLVYEGSPVRHMMGPNGEVASCAFCPRGEFFRDYTAKMIALYAPINADIIWIDDDFRLPNHSPVEYGCFCDSCIADFNTRYGTSFDRSELVREILYEEDTTVRERWLKFQRQGMSELMTIIMKALHAVAPSTIPGLQHAAPGGYIMGNHRFAFDPMHEVTELAPVSRPGGGAYTDYDPNAFIRKGLDVKFQIATLPEYVKNIFPEVENTPHLATGKTPDGTALETSYYLACGANNMSYSMISKRESATDFYAKFLVRFAEQRHYWDALAAANEKTRPTGVCAFVSDDAWARKLPDGADFHKLHSAAHYGTADLHRNGIPFHFEKDADLYLLHPDEVEALSDKDIAKLLTKRVVISGKGVELLRARGVDLGVDAKKIANDHAIFLRSSYTDHPLNNGADGFWISPYIKGENECYLFQNVAERGEILAKYESATNTFTLTDEKDAPYGVTELLLNTKEGGRWLCLGYQPWRQTIASDRLSHLLDLFDTVAEKPLAARMRSLHQAILHPRCNEKGETVCVSVTNCTIAKSEDAVLEIRRPAGEKFYFEGQHHTRCELTPRREDDKILLDLPTLDAWTQGTVFCE